MFRGFDYLAGSFINPHTETDKQTPKRMDRHIQMPTPSGGGNNHKYGADEVNSVSSQQLEWYAAEHVLEEL